MKPISPPRLAPRTLSATPPTPTRLPQPAVREARFPALAVVLAGGVVAPACADPVCGATRADELEAHGRLGAQAARGGEGTRALREIGVALGVVAHGTPTGTTTQGPRDFPAPGAMPVVNPTPPRIDPIPVNGAGAVVPVSPTPPTPPTPSQVTTPGHEPAPMRPGQVRRVTPTPRPNPPVQPRPAVPGGLGAVSPLPSELSHPRTTRT